MSRRSCRIANRRCITLSQAESEVNDIVNNGGSTDEVAIVCLPPDAAVESDLENIDDDDLGELDVVDTAGVLEVEFNPLSDSDSDDELVGPSSGRKRKRPSNRNTKRRCVDRPEIWKTGEIFYGTPIDPDDSVPHLSQREELLQKTPYQLFRCFMDDEVFELITTETQKYALQHNRQRK